MRLTPAINLNNSPATCSGVPTPPDVVARLNKEVNAALADPEMRKRLDDLGCGVFAGSPVDFGKFIADETEKWAKVNKFANIKAE